MPSPLVLGGQPRCGALLHEVRHALDGLADVVHISRLQLGAQLNIHDAIM